MSTLILGCGIIGISTAYHLLELGHRAEDLHIVENAGKPFEGASGYAGGFLASNWYSSHMLPLGRLSFGLHKELAQKHDGRCRWAYAGSTSVSLGPSDLDDGDDSVAKENGADWLLQGTSRSAVAAENRVTERERSNNAGVPDWLRVRRTQQFDVISKGDSTAQVDPLRLCNFLLSYCLEKGVSIHTETSAERLALSRDGLFEGVHLSDGTTLPCKRLLLTSGPWTTQVYKTLFPKASATYSKIRIGALAGHSIIVRSPHWSIREDTRNSLGCYAVFATSFQASKDITGSPSFAPEIFSRHPDEIYIAGLNASNASLPRRADERVVDPDSIAALKDAARQMLRLDPSTEVEVVREGFCFRPTTHSGTPLITKLPAQAYEADCRIPWDGGVWLSAGHGPWGISLSQGTGRVLAEFIMGQKPSINLRPFTL